MDARIETRIAGQLLTETAAALRQRGIRVTELPDDRAADAAPLQISVDSLMPLIQRRRKDVAKGRFAFGEASAFDAQSDLLVVARAHGMHLSKGKAWLTGGLVGALTTTGLRVTATLLLVDPATTEVLGLLQFRGASLDSMGNEIRKLVSKVPLDAGDGRQR
jgi:hypothetical protein